MSDEYTPSTMSIRDVWSFTRATTGDGINHEQARAEFDRWLTGLDAEIRNAALEEAVGIAEHCLLIPDSDAEAYNEAVTDVISALRAVKVVEHEHDPGGCTCGCPVADCADCGGEL